MTLTAWQVSRWEERSSSRLALAHVRGSAVFILHSEFVDASEGWRIKARML
jgi:hypothetical protein